MKKSIFLCLLLCSAVFTSYCQDYSKDSKTAAELIKTKASKAGYKYLITFAECNHAAINVNPKTNYAVLFVYDNTTQPVTHFKGSLMSKDSTLQKKYTQTSYYAGETGLARVKQLRFLTPEFTGETRPVKLDADPKATIYVFYK